jgi:hypothetical protein
MSETDTDEQTQNKYRNAADVLDDATTFEDRTVQTQGKIDLNPTIVEHLGLEGCVIDVRLHTTEETIEITDIDLRPYVGRYKFTIPARKRDLYDIKHNDVLDVEIVNVHRDVPGEDSDA